MTLKQENVLKTSKTYFPGVSEETYNIIKMLKKLFLIIFYLIFLAGDPSLGKIGNQFINENSELFLSEIIPGLENNLAEIFTSTANDIVANASYDEMFPDN